MIRPMLLALAVCAATLVAPLPAPAAAVQPSRTIQKDHVSITVIGRGSPVILIPGLSTPRAVWDGVAPDLAKTHRVYLVQVNGFGGDDPRANLQPGILEAMVAEVHALIAEEKLAKPALVGHSMGGLVGLMLAKAHPGDIGKLLVVDALPFIGEIFAPGATVGMLEPQAAAMRSQLRAAHGAPLPDAMVDAVTANNALKPESRAKIAVWLRAADSRVSGHSRYEDMTTDLRPDMAAIATPITLIYPWSAMLPEARADALYQGAYAKAPHVTYVPVADSGHFVMLDQPAAFAAALADFLK
jgi:pimeloyl-ACP methyl ester carboxylesterase